MRTLSQAKQLVNDWLKHDGSKVTEIDYQKFLNYVAANQALKTVVASMPSALMAILQLVEKQIF